MTQDTYYEWCGICEQYIKTGEKHVHKGILKLNIGNFLEQLERIADAIERLENTFERIEKKL